MTFLKDATPEQQLVLRKMIQEEILLILRMIEGHERVQKKLRKELRFFREILSNRQSLENLKIRLKRIREVIESEESKRL